MASPSADRINARAAKDKAFLKRALRNPGLRSKLDPKYLSASQQQSRALNARLNAPIVQGSSTTERDLANAAQAATTVRYGPQERQINQAVGVAQQTQRDTGSFYDQYRQALQQHAQNVAAYQAGAQAAMAQTAAGITGLAGAEGAALQQQANQTAAPGIPAGNLQGDASAAAAVRQALMGSFQNQQSLQGANANTYADTQANVVAPGQKLSALAQAAGRTRDVQKQLTDLKAEEGAYNQQFRDQRRQDEFKNVLAMQTLGANVAQDQATAASQAARVTETVRHNRTQESIAKARNKAAAKTASEKAALAAGKVNQYGYTDAAWRALSTAQRQKVIKDFKASSSKPQAPRTQAQNQFRQKYGVDPLGTPAHNKARSQIAEIGQWLGRIGGNLGKAGQILTTGQPAGKNSDGSKRPAVPKFDPVLVRAAMDIKQYGGILPGTADRLHHEGYSVASLRLKMGRRPSPRKPLTGAAGKIPGIGAT